MKKAMGGVAAGILTFQLLAGGALGADCANRADMAALKIAALQQELMVAAFSCHDVARYNNFVVSHQPELIASDGNLKSFFERRDGVQRGDAAYHTYKTELANGSSLDYLRNEGFCGRAAGEFAESGDSGALSSFVGLHRWSAADIYPACPGAAVLQTAELTPPPRETRLRDDDDRYAARNWRDAGDDRYAIDDRYPRDEHAQRVFAAPAPHRHLDPDDDR